jgi:hypothetical protein
MPSDAHPQTTVPAAAIDECATFEKHVDGGQAVAYEDVIGRTLFFPTKGSANGSNDWG